MIEVQSSDLAGVDYDWSGTLTIAFHSGGVYETMASRIQNMRSDEREFTRQVFPRQYQKAVRLPESQRMNHMPEDSTSGQKTAMAAVRRVVAEAKELNGAADGVLTDHLAAWIAGQYAVAAGNWRRRTAKEPWIGTCCDAFCHDVVDLRRGDHSAESLRIERERWAAEQAEKKVDLEKQFWEWAKEHQEKICTGFVSQAQKIDLLRAAMFGEAVPDGPPPTQENAK